MSKHICSNCNTEYKYASYLQRHIRNKKGCIKTPVLGDISNNINQIDNNHNDIFSIVNIYDIFTKFINITKQNDKKQEYFELLNNYMNENNIKHPIENNQDIDKTNIDNNKDVIQINSQSNNKTYNCNNCNNIFSSRQSLSNHKKLERCKENKINENNNGDTKTENNNNNNKNKGLTVNDIINSDVELTNNDNTTNNIDNTTNNIDNTTNNNITNNNNITININPFGCESLQHISIKDFSSIFKNFDQLNIILYKLSNLIYIKNNNNMNFTKHNMNKNIVTYLARDMEFKTLSEREFIKEFEKNIRKLCIELFYIHKNNLSVNELIECMKSLLLYYEMLSDTKSKLNQIELKEQLKSIMDSVFRNEDIKIILKQVEKDLLNNPEIKKQCLKKNINRIKEQNKSLDDYDYKPKEDNKDEKNLNKIKAQAFNANLEDNKKYMKIKKT